MVTRCFGSVLLVAALLALPRPATADPITVTAQFTTTSPTGGGGYGFGGPVLLTEMAQSFIAQVTGTLVSVDLLLSRPQPELGTGTLSATIYSAPAGAPVGAALAAQVVSGFLVPTGHTGSWVRISGFMVPVAAGQSYAIALAGTSNFLWFGLTGDLYADGTRSQQFYDSTGEVIMPWRIHPEETGDLNFRAWVDLGTAEPDPVPEPGTLGLIALGGLVLARTRARRTR
ncbi:MAG TPA: PEP-CTERM sorting domain-containing protein [Vicinamibacterales bacterium]|nr:PEP-CTERM sorting domain-containing protein [Vicinamibacterales bacterium]